MSELDKSPAGPRDRNAMVFGGILIAAGAFFLAREMGLVPAGFDFNWWALFIFIPALYTLSNAYRRYMDAGALFTREVRREALTGTALLVVGGILLFDLDWGTLWPIFLILFGLNAMFKGRDEESSSDV